jgi:divalent metal cation (Fe/Co/Zn/Cd) transporter
MGTAASMVISFLVITGAAFIRVQNPVTVSGVGVLTGIVLHFVFGLINGRLVFRSLRLERREKSLLVSAQRRVFTLKLAANVLMFCSLGISFFFREYRWSGYADPVAATFIALSLLAGASRTFKFSIRDLLDSALEERSQLLIMRALADHFDQYEQVHDIRTRCSGGKTYVEIFMTFAPEESHGSVMETIRSIKQQVHNSIECDEVMIIAV